MSNKGGPQARGSINPKSTKSKTDKQVNHENQIISNLNDKYRQTLCGPIVLSKRVQEVSTNALAAILHKVRTFDFTGVDDPDEQHDTGEVIHDGCVYYWRFDYFNPGCDWDVDPADPETRRVLNIMAATEL